MKNQEIYRYEQRLDHLFRRVGETSRQGAVDAELLSDLARYLCVLVSGYLETSVRRILGDYCKSKSSAAVHSYVEKQLDRFQSATAGNTIELLRSFDPSWADNLSKLIDGEIRDAVNSVVSTRHLIAHGMTTGITYAVIASYYSRTKEFVALLEKECAA